jgi:hypothetical protein
MLLMTSSADAIVHSAPLTKFMVTGCYQVCPGVLKKKFSTQQSTWMEMTLEDGSGAAAFGSDDEPQLKIAAGSIGQWGRQKNM